MDATPPWNAGGRRDSSPGYKWLAAIYDRVLGDAAFPIIRDSFDWTVRRCGISFRSAADIGCGTGRFLQHLRRHYGVPAFGVDRSPEMLQMAAARSPDSEARLIRQDLRQLRLPRRVDLITCNFDTINYMLRPRDVMRVFEGCRLNLTPSGHFVFDALTKTGGTSSRDWVTSYRRIDVPGARTLWSASWSQKRGLSLVRILFLFVDRNGRRRVAREAHGQRWYSPSLIVKSLEHNGFVLRGVRDLNDFGAETARSVWLKFVAQKQ